MKNMDNQTKRRVVDFMREYVNDCDDKHSESALEATEIANELEQTLGEEPCAPLANDIVYDVKQFRVGRGQFIFSAEASDLGWPPGMWPNQFKVNGLGNGQFFVKMMQRESVIVYMQELGCVQIEVWND